MEHCDSVELLKRNRIRVTRRKTAILREIIECGRPLNAAELHDRVSATVGLDLATVYRTLGAFVESRLVREITDDTGTQYYEIACRHNPAHPHFKCVRCRRITCLESLDSEDTALIFSKVFPHGEITGIAITVSGVCRTCGSEE
jgi:Fur family ferric uptake transcriptional regulator